MKQINTAIILAGGKGTRLSEQTKVVPKPLVKIGPDPMIFHIIRHFVRNGVTNFYIATGYKSNLIIEEFRKYFSVKSIDNKDTLNIVVNEDDLLWKAKINIIDTGYTTGTAQRIKHVLNYIKNTTDEDEVYITYGDSLSNVKLKNVNQTLNNDSSNILVLTAVKFQERFGILHLNSNNKVSNFTEKSMSKDEFINGGYMASKLSLIDYIEDEDDDFSTDTLPRLQQQNKLGAYAHEGFWFAVDSQRDWEKINQIYDENPDTFLL